MCHDGFPHVTFTLLLVSCFIGGCVGEDPMYSKYSIKFVLMYGYYCFMPYSETIEQTCGDGQAIRLICSDKQF